MLKVFTSIMIGLFFVLLGVLRTRGFINGDVGKFNFLGIEEFPMEFNLGFIKYGVGELLSIPDFIYNNALINLNYEKEILLYISIFSFYFLFSFLFQFGLRYLSTSRDKTYLSFITISVYLLALYIF